MDNETARKKGMHLSNRLRRLLRTIYSSCTDFLDFTYDSLEVDQLSEPGIVFLVEDHENLFSATEDC